MIPLFKAPQYILISQRSFAARLRTSRTNPNPVQHRLGAGADPGRSVSSVLGAVRGVQGEDDVGFALKQTPEVLQELAALRVGMDVFHADGLGGEQHNMQGNDRSAQPRSRFTRMNYRLGSYAVYWYCEAPP